MIVHVLDPHFGCIDEDERKNAEKNEVGPTSVYSVGLCSMFYTWSFTQLLNAAINLSPLIAEGNNDAARELAAYDRLMRQRKGIKWEKQVAYRKLELQREVPPPSLP